MTDMFIPPNGCVFCEEVQRTHPQKYDNLHPRGERGYTAPSHTLRKIRILMNRLRRKKWLNEDDWARLYSEPSTPIIASSERDESVSSTSGVGVSRSMIPRARGTR